MRLLGKALGTLAAAATVAVLGTSAALAAAPAASVDAGHHVGASAHAVASTAHALRTSARATPAVTVHCNSGTWCLYKGQNATSECTDSSGNVPNLEGCANVDESFANFTSHGVRLYYAQQYGGDWICLNPGAKGNLAGVEFNNGPAGSSNGAGQSVYRNVHAIGVGSTCSNPTSIGF